MKVTLAEGPSETVSAHYHKWTGWNALEPALVEPFRYFGVADDLGRRIRAVVTSHPLREGIFSLGRHSSTAKNAVSTRANISWHDQYEEVHMKPSDTQRGKRWITNFDRLEQPYAQLMLDSLRIVGTSEMRSGMKELLYALSETDIQHPAMLVAARKMNEFVRHDHEPRFNPGPKKDVAFQTFNPGQALPALPGSEGLMGSIIRDLIREPGRPNRKWMGPATTLDQLRSEKCRSIVLLSDYSGSGTQLINYSLALRRNPTLRSWISSGNLKVYAVTFSVSRVAENALFALGKRRPELYQVEPALDFESAAWDEVERKAIIDLCIRYAKRPGRGKRSEALGYAGSKGLFATDSTIPNNLPIILRQMRPNWSPFFEGRVMPTDIGRSLIGYHREAKEHSEHSDARLQNDAWNDGFAEIKDLSLAALESVQAGEGSPEAVARSLGLKISMARQITTFLRENGLMSSNGRITAAGTREVRLRKIAATRRQGVPDFLEEPYYPLSLR